MREAIALAAYHGPGVHQHYESLRAIKNLNLATIGQCPIDAARSFLLHVALEKTPCDVFVFIDSDVAFPPEAYERIVQSCLETKAIVAGCYLTKSLEGNQALAGVLTNQDQEVVFFEKGGLIPARIVPLGFTAIHRSAAQKIIDSGQAGERCTLLHGSAHEVNAYPFFMPMVAQGIYQSEDCAFSLRAKAAGVDLYFDTRPRLRHFGPHGYRITDIQLVSQDYQEAWKQPQTELESPPSRHYPPGMGRESRRLHREYNRLVREQLAGAENAAEVRALTDEAATKGIVLVPRGENL